MIGIILAHGKALDTFNRHYEGWKKAFSAIIIVCPWDDPIPGGCTIGDSAHNGRGNLERMLFVVALASRFPRAAIVEYDTVFCDCRFDIDFPHPDTLVCSVQFKSDDPQFMAPSYGHSPWIATGETWWKLMQNGGAPEGCFPDRWLYAAAHSAGIITLGIANAFSDDREWTPLTRIKAAGWRAKGGNVFHGIKTQRDFDSVHYFYQFGAQTTHGPEDSTSNLATGLALPP